MSPTMRDEGGDPGPEWQLHKLEEQAIEAAAKALHERKYGSSYRDPDWRVSGDAWREDAQIVVAAYRAARPRATRDDDRAAGALKAFAEWLEYGIDLSDKQLQDALTDELISVTRPAYLWRSGIAILRTARAALSSSPEQTGGEFAEQRLRKALNTIILLARQPFTVIRLKLIHDEAIAAIEGRGEYALSSSEQVSPPASPEPDAELHDARIRLDERHIVIDELESKIARLVPAIGALKLAKEALDFARCCDVSGENGWADHSTVIAALEAIDETLTFAPLFEGVSATAEPTEARINRAITAVLDAYDDWSVNSYPADGGGSQTARAWFQEAERVERAIEDLRAVSIPAAELTVAYEALVDLESRILNMTEPVAGVLNDLTLPEGAYKTIIEAVEESARAALSASPSESEPS